MKMNFLDFSFFSSPKSPYPAAERWELACGDEALTDLWLNWCRILPLPLFMTLYYLAILRAAKTSRPAQEKRKSPTG